MMLISNKLKSKISKLQNQPKKLMNKPNKFQIMNKQSKILKLKMLVQNTNNKKV